MSLMNNNNVVSTVFISFLCFILICSSGDIGSVSGIQTTDNSIYGVLITLPYGEDTTNETFENSRTRYLINDLLRENISVYWTLHAITLEVKPFYGQQLPASQSFNQGMFLVPFTNNVFQNTKIIAAVADYNLTHELDSNSSEKIHAYLITQPLQSKCRKLIEPRIAQHLGLATRYGWPVYMQIADVGGFHTYEFLTDKDIDQRLNNVDFNVFMWPYLPIPANYFEEMITLGNKNVINTIRTFIRNGGGYIGSCYGAFSASAGFIGPLTFKSIRYAQNPELNCSFPCYGVSISDTVMNYRYSVSDEYLIATSYFTNLSHPLFFGVSQHFKDLFKGPWFIWIGPQTKVLSTFEDIYPWESGEHDDYLTKLFVGRANYVESSFGAGKVILFSSHPEYVNNVPPVFYGNNWEEDIYYGRRLLHNAMLYTSASEPIAIQLQNTLPQQLISSIITATENLTLSNEEFNVQELQQNLSYLADKLFQINELTEQLFSLFSLLENNSVVFANGRHLLVYTHISCSYYRYYVNQSMKVLAQLSHVLPLIEPYNNDTIFSLVENVFNDVNTRIIQADSLLNETIKQETAIKQLLLKPTITIVDRLNLLLRRRVLLVDFELGLQLFPQMYFETNKVLRKSWYTYEAYIGSDN